MAVDRVAADRAVAADKPAAQEGKLADRQAGPKVEERRGDKLEALEIQGSGTTPGTVTQMMSPGGVSRISLANKTGSTSFSNRR